MIKFSRQIVAITLILTGLAGTGMRFVEQPAAETKALAFLQREVPAWRRENGCFSCHNNGDAARALFAAAGRGVAVPKEALTETLDWLRAPEQWEQNKGDPGFSDKRLAKLQFAASLRAAVQAGLVTDRDALQVAARKLLAEQDTDGTWKMDAGNTLGSPATWGTPLATWMALEVLRAANLTESKSAQHNAEQALRQLRPQNVFTMATLLLAFAEDQMKREEYLPLLLRAQSQAGGWGPYADAPSEVFDTALVLLALARQRQEAGVTAALQRGRAFLLAQQNADGSWPATTRPSGGDSYAQQISTTGWATLALLETKD